MGNGSIIIGEEKKKKKNFKKNLHKTKERIILLYNAIWLDNYIQIVIKKKKFVYVLYPGEKKNSSNVYTFHTMSGMGASLL